MHRGDAEAIDRGGGRRADREHLLQLEERQVEVTALQRQAREATVPMVGGEAPDFVAEMLGRDGARTGEQVRLSDLRGKPVGLVFGSYT
ncbi:MAG TPA: hypothetical protein EYP98_07005 [Planctomycetes bacterium]|nr:hypothetical protein [Planctomycetota bacterium]